jgi:hypothetical protein
MAVNIPVDHPTTKSTPRKVIRSFGTQTPVSTALTMTADKAALGVGLMTLMYGNATIQMHAVNRHASWEVVPVIRETKDRLMEPDTGADPTNAATPHDTPWAVVRGIEAGVV